MDGMGRWSLQGVPDIRLCSLGVIFLSDSMANSVVSPLLPFMVQFFFRFPENHENRIGYFVGLLAAAYPSGHLISSSFWGTLVKKWGRRRVLFICIAGTMIFQISMGLSTTFVGALMARFFQGLCSGSTTVAKSYIAEISDSSTEPTVFMVLGVVFIAGNVIGSLLGGLLSTPQGNEPLLSLGIWSPYFLNRPFLLPVIVTSAHSALSLLALFTIHGPPRFRASSGSYLSIRDLNKGPVDSEGERGDAYSDLYGDVPPGSRSEDDQMNQLRAYSDLFMVSESDLSDPFTSGDETRAARSDNSSGKRRVTPSKAGLTSVSLITPNTTRTARMQQQISEKLKAQEQRVYTVRLTAVIYWLYCAVYASFNEIFVLWAMTSRHAGGASFSIFAIGFVQSSAGLCTALAFTVLYPLASQACSIITSYRVGLLFSLLFAYPIPIILSMYEVAGDNALTWLALMLAIGVNAIGVEFSFASINGLLDACSRRMSEADSVPTQQELNAHLRSMLNNTALAVGPIIMGTLYASSMCSAHLLPSLIEGRLCFWTLMALVFINLMLTLALPWTSQLTRPASKIKQTEMT